MKEIAPPHHLKMFVLFACDDYLAIEPPLQSGNSMCLVLSQRTDGPMLVLESRSGLVISPHAHQITVFCLIGVVQLLRGSYLGVVTESVPVCRVGLDGAEFNKVLRAEFIPIPGGETPKLSLSQSEAEAHYLELLHRIVDTHSLYYSHHYDITQTAQRIAMLNGKTKSSQGKKTTSLSSEKASLNQRADPRFYWNKHMVKCFEDYEFEEWIHPLMCGHVEVCYNMTFESSEEYFTYVFISRKSRNRQGTRFNMRGVDEAGHAANFVEIEQIFIPQESSGNGNSVERSVALCSYVQTRGSIPVAWSQQATAKYTPETKILGSFEDSFSRFSKHFNNEHSIDLYNAVLGINLIDNIGKSKSVRNQRELGELYENCVNKLADDRLRFTWFDFHHECRKMQYHNLSKLIKMCSNDMAEFGFFVLMSDGNVSKWQNGVVRTNCMDNLDRTNAVQVILARYNFIEVMLYLKNIEPSVSRRESFHKNVLNSECRMFECHFEKVWRNNADVLSILYAGTPALKTRLGIIGKLQDGANSVTRYFINNFTDAYKQDAFDLFLGKLVPTDITFVPLSKAPGNNSLLIAQGIVALVFSVMLLFLMSSVSLLRMASATTLIVILTGLYHVLNKGVSPLLLPSPQCLE